MTGTHLPGLEGTNPLAFFAALGVQVAFEGEEKVPRLWWSDDVVPHAVVDAEFSVDEITSQVLTVAAEWKGSEALYPQFFSGKNRDDVKFEKNEIRTYLGITSKYNPSDRIAQALVAEGSLDNNEKAKPTDLHFSAGPQLFLDMARKVLDGVEGADIFNALTDVWEYNSKLPTLGWDVVDDRLYALLPTKPTPNNKSTNPGPEALAILGLSRHPVFGSSSRTLTLGCSGTWKNGSYTWPIWNNPANSGAVSSLLAHATHFNPNSQSRKDFFKSWSLSRILQSAIRRSSQGGYGTFGPAQVIWSRE